MSESDKEPSEDMNIYLDRIGPLKLANLKIQEEIMNRKFGAYSLLMKRSAIRQALKKNNLFEDFREEWDEILKEHNKARLPHFRNLFAEQDLFFALDDLMDSYMDKVGMSGFENKQDREIKVSVNGGEKLE